MKKAQLIQRVIDQIRNDLKQGHTLELELMLESVSERDMELYLEPIETCKECYEN